MFSRTKPKCDPVEAVEETTATRKRTSTSQERLEDERRNAKPDRPNRGIGGGHRGNQDHSEIKGYLGHGRGIEKAGSEAGAVHLFFGGSTADNINDIFRSKEAIAVYRKSLIDEVGASLLANMDANEQDKLKCGYLQGTASC